jgi:hypothetical protein
LFRQHHEGELASWAGGKLLERALLERGADRAAVMATLIMTALKRMRGCEFTGISRRPGDRGQRLVDRYRSLRKFEC